MFFRAFFFYRIVSFNFRADIIAYVSMNQRKFLDFVYFQIVSLHLCISHNKVDGHSIVTSLLDISTDLSLILPVFSIHFVFIFGAHITCVYLYLQFCVISRMSRIAVRTDIDKKHKPISIC